MEITGQLHDTAALPPAFTVQEAGWAVAWVRKQTIPTERSASQAILLKKNSCEIMFEFPTGL
jgi:hypothetical protein